jgi:two-component system, NarL family, response regulator NreC
VILKDPSKKPREVESISVLIADDHGLVRTGLLMILETEPDIRVVGEAADGARALELALALRPSIVLADISMPPPDGIELTRLLRRDLPGTRTLVVSMHEDEGIVREALAAGAAGYLVKRAAPSDLIRAVRSVASGQLYLDADIRQAYFPQPEARIV